MKLIYLVVKILILLVCLLLAVSNVQTVQFNYLPGQGIDLPLIVVLFGMFVIGAVFGIFAMFGRLLRLRAENNRLRGEVKKTARITATEVQPAAPAAAAPSDKAKV